MKVTYIKTVPPPQPPPKVEKVILELNTDEADLMYRLVMKLSPCEVERKVNGKFGNNDFRKISEQEIEDFIYFLAGACKIPNHLK